MSFKKQLSKITAATLLAAPFSVALAQNGQPHQMQQQAPKQMQTAPGQQAAQKAPSLNQKQIDNFLAVHKDLMAVNKKAEKKAKKVIKDHGMTIPQYQQLTQKISSNPKLMKQVQAQANKQ